MPERNVLIGFPGISMTETRTGYEGSVKFVPEWLIEMFFELKNYSSAQQEKLRKQVERRFIRVDISWSVKEQMRPEEAGAKFAPITKDIISAAAERGITREEARQALLEEGGYELANLPNELIDLVDQGRMDVVVFDRDRQARMNAKRDELRFRSFDLLSLLRIFQSKKIDICSIKRFERKGGSRRAKMKGPAALVTRTGPRTDESFEYITYVELPTAEKRGLILVMPTFVIWNLGSVAIGDLAWAYTRFITAVEAVDNFLDLPKPAKTEIVSESKATEEEVDDEDDDPTPDPDLDESAEAGSQEAPATAN